ncbi:cysteine protease family C02 [Thraustotheca clavata]|uniref:Cysteine protease family C02 n=1 Tax=Thraustotheca clavata TaxID=74557 RepID=A0A1V9ZZS3_9STRA|nr:cysteine protease family C02 [Thraustotheca clavata]
MELEQNLKEHGVEVVCSKMDTIITMHAHGATGKRLVETLRLMDKYVALKVTKLVKSCDGHIYCDPCFGPNATDSFGAFALCKFGDVIPSKGGSQHQAKVLKLLKEDKLRWERPRYASSKCNVLENDDTENESPVANDEPVFCEQGELFRDGLVSSGDVIQGNLGDCWFLGAISVLATRSDLLAEVFWREDQYKNHGLFVCRFMKDFSWHYVIIDDRIPVFGYTNNRAGKPFFARCSDPNELWVPLIEKAYAKLHASYEALIGGYLDVALSDLTGLCSEQVILKAGFPGFAEDPFQPVRQGQKRGDEFWAKLLEYKRNGTLMGCSIQPDPKGDKNVVAEGSAGQGLYYKHAYGLVDVGEIVLEDKSTLRLVKVRNPWGMGEWTGPWSDQSEEREKYDDEIQRVFKVISRNLGGNAYSTLYRESFRKEIKVYTEGQQEDITEINQNDGTFFMTFDDWIARYTHFFAGIDFADEWCGFRVEGKWDEASCGGNTSKSTWINNPRFQLHVYARCKLFVSVSQNDPRGKSDAPPIVPIGFHICSVEEKDNKCEIREPKKKAPQYYRLYNEATRAGLLNGTILESSPPTIIPGTFIPGIDDDGVPQPAYTLKQAASVGATIEPGRYCIVPSLYMRTDKATGKTNVGRFWISVYGEKPVLNLEGGEPIIEEEEANENSPQTSRENDTMDMASAPESLTPIEVPGETARRLFEDLKEELLSLARAKGIGFRQAQHEFSNVGPMRRADFKRHMLNLGFKLDEVSDEKVNILFQGLTKDKSNTIHAGALLEIFVRDIEEDRIVAIVPEKEDDEVPEKINQDGILELHLIGGKDLQSVEVLQQTPPLLSFPALSYSPRDRALQDACIVELLEEEPSLLHELHPKFLLALRPHDSIFQSHILELIEKVKAPSSKKPESRRRPKKKLVKHDTTPVQHFFSAVVAKYRATLTKEEDQRQTEVQAPAKDRRPSGSQKFNWTALESPATENTNSAQSNEQQMKLHSSAYMQSLELKRCERFRAMQAKKAQVFGDKQKQANLPRLLGGRKSGTNTLHCVDCRATVVLSGKGDTGAEFTCMAQGCINMFCSNCFNKLPDGEKFCDDCYLHENNNVEVLGVQLRSLLLTKLAASDSQLLALDEIFSSLDQDKSGDLTTDEFTTFLEKLKLNPPLTSTQISALMSELDIDGNGTLSLDELKKWMLGSDPLWAPEMQTEEESWLPTPGAPRRTTLDEAESLKVIPWMQTILQELVQDVCTITTEQPANWCITSATAPTIKYMTKPQLDKRLEKENIIFQRVIPIAVIDGSTEECDGIAKLFSRFDINGDGSIASDELALLLDCIGLPATPLDVKLLSHRLERKENYIYLSDFAAFIDCSSTRVHESQLLAKLIELEQLCKEHRIHEEEVKMSLQHLHSTMTIHEMLWLSKQLLTLIGFRISLNMLERLALVCTPCIHDSTLTCAGDILLYLLQAPLGLSGSLAKFSLESVSDSIQRLFKIEASDDEQEWDKLGHNQSEEMDQSWFIECLLRRGLKVTDSDSLFVESQVTVALALDALRYRDSQLPPLKPSHVNRGLFLSLSRYTTLQHLEDKLRQTLERMSRVGSGQQMYQVVISTGYSEDTLHIRAIDSVQKQIMTLQFYREEINHHGLPLFTRSRESNANWQNGVVNSEWYPEINQYLLTLATRLRICFREDNGKKQPFLEFLESREFVSKLRHLLHSTRVPFFWAVSSSMLEFSIDGATLSAAKMRLQPFTMQSILKFPSLASFFREVHSTLRVHLEVLDQTTSMWMGWNEFKACLAGLCNAYASIQLLPQGDIFLTSPDEGGGCTPQWNYTTKIGIREPAECIHRSDRPVVYVDTQPILGKPDSSGENLIPFTTLQSKPTKQKHAVLHFVVVSVRKTIPSTPEPSTLYCTAYDPITASDYEVIGTPKEWNLSFFDPDINKDFESQWLSMVCTLKLGRTITPKLLIRLYNKQPRSDQLIGETEVSIASTMAREGYGVNSWFSIYDPVSQLCTGQLELHAQFEMKTKSSEGNKAIAIPPRKSVPKPELPTPRLFPNNDAELAQYQQRILELESQLKAKSDISNSDSNNNIKWKRKYEQMKQDAIEQQAANDAKLTNLKNKLDAVNSKTSQQPSSPGTPQIGGNDAVSAFSNMKMILVSRCPERPFNALKNAMIAVAEMPGKVSPSALTEVLHDFGLQLKPDQRINVLQLLDPKNSGQLAIEDFFVMLNGGTITNRSVDVQHVSQASNRQKETLQCVEEPTVPSPPKPNEAAPTPPVSNEKLSENKVNPHESRSTKKLAISTSKDQIKSTQNDNISCQKHNDEVQSVDD